MLFASACGASEPEATRAAPIATVADSAVAAQSVPERSQAAPARAPADSALAPQELLTSAVAEARARSQPAAVGAPPPSRTSPADTLTRRSAPGVFTLDPDRLRFAIGEADGKPEEVFGRIKAILVDEQLGIFVLDALMLEIRWYSADGVFMAKAGRAGAGPGEFRAPVGMALDAAGRLHVIDMARRRISVFSTAGDSLSHIEDVRTELAGHAVCLLRGAYYILAPDESAVLHRVARDGTVIASFGSPLFEADADLAMSPTLEEVLRIRQNTGRIHCSEAQGSVVLFHNSLPIVRAFSDGGQLLWHTELLDYHTVRHVKRGRFIQLAPDPETGTAHTGEGMAPLDEETIAITLAEGALLRGSESELEVRLISLIDGREVRRLPSPVVFDGITDLLIYGHVYDPIPRIMAYDR